jgi:hypothetical protein
LSKSSGGRREPGARQAEGLDDELLDGRLIRQSGHGLDDPTGTTESRVVVRVNLPDRGELRQVSDVVHVAGERAVVGPGVVDVLAEPPGGVIEELADGDALRPRRGDEAVHVAVDPLVEHEAPLVDEVRGGRTGERLADRCGAEQRVGVDRLGVAHVGHAVSAHVRAAAPDDA